MMYLIYLALFFLACGLGWLWIGMNAAAMSDDDNRRGYWFIGLPMAIGLIIGLVSVLF